MNILAHGLWGVAFAAIDKKINTRRAVFWAIFPDLFWGVVFVPYLFLFKQPIPLDFADAPRWFYHLYGFSHSFVVSGIVIVVVSFLSKNLPREMLAWPFLHILPDIFGHIHFRTPFLYPLSNFSLLGPFSWHEPLSRIISFLFPLVFLAIFSLRKKASLHG